MNKVRFKRFMIAICISPKPSFILSPVQIMRKTSFKHAKEMVLMPYMCYKMYWSLGMK